MVLYKECSRDKSPETPSLLQRLVILRTAGWEVGGHSPADVSLRPSQGAARSGLFCDNGAAPEMPARRLQLGTLGVLFGSREQAGVQTGGVGGGVTPSAKQGARRVAKNGVGTERHCGPESRECVRTCRRAHVHALLICLHVYKIKSHNR